MPWTLVGKCAQLEPLGLSRARIGPGLWPGPHRQARNGEASGGSRCHAGPYRGLQRRLPACGPPAAGVWPGRSRPGHTGGTGRCRLDGKRQCPQGAIRGVPGTAGARRAAGAASGSGAGRVGRHSLLLLFPCPVRAAGDECGGARPGLRGVSSSVPAFLNLGGRSRCPRPPGAFDLSCPLDDQLASRPEWAGIVLHPYPRGLIPIPVD